MYSLNLGFMILNQGLIVHIVYNLNLKLTTLYKINQKSPSQQSPGYATSNTFNPHAYGAPTTLPSQPPPQYGIYDAFRRVVLTNSI